MYIYMPFISVNKHNTMVIIRGDLIVILSNQKVYFKPLVYLSHSSVFCFP